MGLATILINSQSYILWCYGWILICSYMYVSPIYVLSLCIDLLSSFWNEFFVVFVQQVPAPLIQYRATILSNCPVTDWLGNFRLVHAICQFVICAVTSLVDGYLVISPTSCFTTCQFDTTYTVVDVPSRTCELRFRLCLWRVPWDCKASREIYIIGEILLKLSPTTVKLYWNILVPG